MIGALVGGVALFTLIVVWALLGVPTAEDRRTVLTAPLDPVEHVCDPPALHPWMVSPRWLCTDCMTAYRGEWTSVLGVTVRVWVPQGVLASDRHWACPECDHALIPVYLRSWGRKIRYRRCVSCAYALLVN